jgi:hypothetical protein
MKRYTIEISKRYGYVIIDDNEKKIGQEMEEASGEVIKILLSKIDISKLTEIEVKQ